MNNKNLIILLTAFFLGLPAMADPAIDQYLTTTNPIMSEIKQLDKDYIAEVQPLREARNLVGLKSAADRYAVLWSTLGTKLDGLTVPADAQTYHDSIKRLIELQILSNTLMSKIVGEAIITANEAKDMKEAGKSTDEIQAYLESKAPARTDSVNQLRAVGTESKAVDNTLITEYQRLNEK